MPAVFYFGIIYLIDVMHPYSSFLITFLVFILFLFVFEFFFHICILCTIISLQLSICTALYRYTLS